MKKFLLSLATLALAATTAMADQVTVTMADEGYSNQQDVTTLTKDPVTFSFGKGSNSNGPKYYTTGNALRLYGGNTMTISVADGYELTSVVLKTPTGANAVNAETTVTNGTIEISGGTTTLTANANVTNMTMTEGGSSGHARIQSIVVNYSEVGGKTPAGLKFSEISCTGIVGQPFTAPTLTKATDAVVTYTSQNPEVATVDATGAVTLLAGGTATIKATTPETDTYAAGEAQYTITVTASYDTLAAYLAACSQKDDSGYINFPLTVTYTNGAYTYVEDNDGTAGLIYKYDLGYAATQVIPAGWMVKTDVYNELIELKPVGDMPEVETTRPVVIERVTSVDESMISKILVLENVTFANDTPSNKASFTGTANGTDYTFYNQFETATTEAGVYNVKIAVSKRYDVMQLFPIEYTQVKADAPVITANVNEDNEFATTAVVTITAAEGATIYYRTVTGEEATADDTYQIYTAPFTITGTTTVYAYAEEEGKVNSDIVSATYTYNPSDGIDSINVEEGNAEYYNMQGVRVSNPENGMYIRVQNGKTQKVIVK